jgi:Cu(I)/Ag(I) efflux system membrane fusion protein
MCRERIEESALSVNGVAVATWNADTRKISVEFDNARTDLTTIQKAIAKVGHDTELFKADDVTYKALPECCYYRK